MKQSITFFHMSLLFIIVSSIHYFLVVLPLVLTDAKRDAWLSVIISGAIALIWIGIIYFIILKLEGQALFEYILLYSGKIFTNILNVVFVVYLLLTILMSLRTIIYVMKSIYFPMTPVWIIACLFILFAIYATTLGFRSIVMIGGMVFPLFVLLTVFVTYFNIPHTDLIYLLPFMENGLKPVISGGMKSFLVFSEFIWLLFFTQYLPKTPKKRVFVLMITVLTIIMLLTILQGITSFGPIQAANHLFLYYEYWRVIQVSKFLEHVDFLSAFVWLSASFIRIAFLLFIIKDILLVTQKRKQWIILILSIFIILSTIILFSNQQLNIWMEEYYSQISILFVVVITVVIGIHIYVTKGWRKNVV